MAAPRRRRGDGRRHHCWRRRGGGGGGPSPSTATTAGPAPGAAAGAPDPPPQALTQRLWRCGRCRRRWRGSTRRRTAGVTRGRAAVGWPGAEGGSTSGRTPPPASRRQGTRTERSADGTPFGGIRTGMRTETFIVNSAVRPSPGVSSIFCMRSIRSTDRRRCRTRTYTRRRPARAVEANRSSTIFKAPSWCRIIPEEQLIHCAARLVQPRHFPG